jgi:streptogramin lyase
VSFGDGFYLSGANASHTYVNNGSFRVSVAASDKAGNTSDPAPQTVTVGFNPVLFVGIGGGKIAEFDKSGTLLRTLNSNQGGSMTGMAFDAAGNLYATNFTADTVSKFSPEGALLGTYGSGYNCKPESIVFDSAGNAYVGETGCSHALLGFDPYGNLTASYTVATEAEGSDWIDLAPDGCTIFYTSQGASVLRFDACNKNQLPPFSSSLKEGLALRVLSDGGVLVANLENIVRLDSAGRTISTYVASGEKCWASLALDSDGSSFWAADYCTSDVIRFDLTSGNQLFKFNTGTPANTVFGLTERTAESAHAPAGSLIASPSQSTISSGQSASYALAFAPAESAGGQTVSFSCGNLPRGAGCSFSPQTAVATVSTVTANLTITTTAGTSAWMSIAPGKLALYGLWLPLALVFVPTEAAKRRLGLLAALILFSILLACSGAKSTNVTTSPIPSAPVAGTVTPAGAYTIVIHARAGAMDSSTAVQLTVQ